MIQNDSNMWLSEQVLNWKASCCGTSSTKPQDFFRAYELLQHAESLITTSTNDFQLADGISNLKRALNQRLKYIDQLYSVSAAFPKNVGFLECLHELGLARPFVIKQLLEIRNSIEHKDAPPPTRMRCLELLDITWYLLKSTDSICSHQRNEIEFQCSDESIGEQYSFSVQLHRRNVREIQFRCWVPSTFISTEEQVGFFQCQCEKARAKSEIVLPNDEFKKLREIKLSFKCDDDLLIDGGATLQPHLYKRILKKLLVTTPNLI